MEVTVEAVRHRVGATVTPTPFFNPPRKTAQAGLKASTTTVVAPTSSNCDDVVVPTFRSA